MRLVRLQVQDYKLFHDLDLQLDGRSTVIFGVNGTGKSTILSAVNYLFRVWINRINPSQGKSYESFGPEMIRHRAASLMLSADIELGDKRLSLKRSYVRPKPGMGTAPTFDRSMYMAFTERFREAFLLGPGTRDMPVFVNYGTNRSVLDIPLRIRKKHDFSQVSALEYAVENTLDFRAFFEWFRNQEDLENQIAKEKGELSYHDKQLASVRRAIERMLGNVSDLRVRRNPLSMIVTKGGKTVRVDTLSDGEKCTLALFGDLARRLAIANPNRDDPLEGEGIVLIDEIELHMHPSWQRRVLKVLKEVFPHIQFLITTHSPQVLGETDDSYNVFLISEDGENGCWISKIKRMDGYDSNMILGKFMDTAAESDLKRELVERIDRLIIDKDYTNAEERLQFLRELSGDLDKDYIIEKEFLRRSRILDEKNRP